MRFLPHLFSHLVLGFTAFSTLVLAGNARGVDCLKITEAHSKTDTRHAYRYALYTAILEKSVPAFGPYEIQKPLNGLPRKRAFLELKSGKHLNAHAVPTCAEWENNTLPIRIPIRKGLLGYRLLLINKQQAPLFASLHSIDELKKLRGGLRRQWSTTKLLADQNFSLVTTNNYEGLFQMLAYGCFDYFLRGANEIFGEFDARSATYPSMAIEETLLIQLPLPTYIFVSPQEPRLAKRLEHGLKRMIADGSFDALFWKYHGKNIERAHLSTRRLLSIENPDLSELTPFDTKEYWIDLKSLK